MKLEVIIGARNIARARARSEAIADWDARRGEGWRIASLTAPSLIRRFGSAERAEAWAALSQLARHHGQELGDMPARASWAVFVR